MHAYSLESESHGEETKGASEEKSSLASYLRPSHDAQHQPAMHALVQLPNTPTQIKTDDSQITVIINLVLKFVVLQYHHYVA